MATDNTTVLNGDVIRNKLRTSVKTQIVGLDINIGGSTEKLVQAGQQTMANSLPVVLPSDQVVLTASNDNYVVSAPTITVTAGTAYASGDCVGGKLTLTGISRINDAGVKLETIFVTDAANQKPNLKFLFFNADPTAATLTNDAALALSTDITKVIGMASVDTGDYTTISSAAFAAKNGINAVLKSTTTSVWMAILTTSTPTFTGTTNLSVKLGFSRDF